MSRIIRVIIQNYSYLKKTERRLEIERSGKCLISLFLTSSLLLFWCKEFWIITLIIYPTHLLYFGEVETLYCSIYSFIDSILWINTLSLVLIYLIVLILWKHHWIQPQILRIRNKVLLNIENIDLEKLGMHDHNDEEA